MTMRRMSGFEDACRVELGGRHLRTIILESGHLSGAGSGRRYKTATDRVKAAPPT